jgi:hypothetical protein
LAKIAAVADFPLPIPPVRPTTNIHILFALLCTGSLYMMAVAAAKIHLFDSDLNCDSLSAGGF